MEAVDWEHEERRFSNRIAELGATPKLALRNENGTVLLAHSQFEAFEGEYEAAPYLMLALCTAHVGRLGRFSDGLTTEGVLRPGSVAIALPDTKAEGFWPRAQMLGIAVDLGAFACRAQNVITVDDLVPAASTLHRDPLLSSVMTAIWRDAELHGLSTLFFEHGMAVILDRLAGFKARPAQRANRPLSKARLNAVKDAIESRIGSDIRTADLAAIAGQDERSFCRAFRTATGLAPYEYLTVRRIEHAKQLMLGGLRVTDAAIAVGYSNPSKFAAAFRRVCGETPTAWRLSAKSVRNDWPSP